MGETWRVKVAQDIYEFQAVTKQYCSFGLLKMQVIS